MAESKKPTAKKTASAKKAPAKKTVAKVAAKPAAKKPAPAKAAKPAAKKALREEKPGEVHAQPIPAITPTQINLAALAEKRAGKAQGTRKVTFKIQRALREDGELKTWFQDYEVEFDHSTTVLQALENIKGDQDGTLTFRRSCRASICGSCGMFINNRSRLACKTKVHDLVDGNPYKNLQPAETITIRPQNNQPVVKDLAIELTPFFDKVEGIEPYVQAGTETEKHVTKTAFEQVNLVSNCIMCGLCYSDCTAMVENPDFIGPAALAKAFRFVADPREGNKTHRLKALSEKNGIWDCTRCGMCLDACPKGVDPMEAIVKLRTRAIQNPNVPAGAGERHARVFKKDIATWGILNEPFMLLKTLHVGALGQLGNALNLAKKGKIPNPFPFDHRVEGLDEVQKIYDILQQNPIDVETKAEDTGPGAG